MHYVPPAYIDSCFCLLKQCFKRRPMKLSHGVCEVFPSVFLFVEVATHYYYI